MKCLHQCWIKPDTGHSCGDSVDVQAHCRSFACGMLCQGMTRLAGRNLKNCALPALPGLYSRNQDFQQRFLRHAVVSRRAASAHSAGHSPNGQVRQDSPNVTPPCSALHQCSQFPVQKGTNAVLSVLAKSNDALPYAVVLAALLALLLPPSFAWFTPRWAMWCSLPTPSG